MGKHKPEKASLGKARYAANQDNDEYEEYTPRSKNTRCTKAMKLARMARIQRMIAQGANSLDIVQYCSQEWGLSQKHGRTYWREAIEHLKEHIEMDRAEFAAVLLMQVNDLQKKTAQRQNDAVTLGCINTAAKIAGLL